MWESRARAPEERPANRLPSGRRQKANHHCQEDKGATEGALKIVSIYQISPATFVPVEKRSNWNLKGPEELYQLRG
jgi:hypothetical protein